MTGQEKSPPDVGTSERAKTGKETGDKPLTVPYSTTPRACGQDIFTAVKDAVTVERAAVFYGLAPNRARFLRCPFHSGGNERTPSLKLYDDGFKCFACGASGTVIDFTGRLFDLSPLDAVKRLNADFQIGLSLDRHALTPEELEAVRRRRDIRDTQRLFDAWRESALWALSRAIRIGFGALRDGTPDTWTPGEVLAIKQHGYLEYLYEALEAGSEAEQFDVLREWSKGVGDLVRDCTSE